MKILARNYFKHLNKKIITFSDFLLIIIKFFKIHDIRIWFKAGFNIFINYIGKLNLIAPWMVEDFSDSVH